ncbi:MAG: carbon monoxide dehydrogenase subunit G [Anaerolineae bacterium]|nr:carbon monoxide dehydrogenase subunit G [Anaerolineae bacterium]
MQISGEYVFDAPRDRVWLAVRDPDVLGTILPGGQGIEEIGENQYAGKLQIKIGPVQGVFDGKIALSNLVAPQSYDVVVDGKGAPGFVNASGSLLLTEQGDKTHMVYERDGAGGRSRCRSWPTVARRFGQIDGATESGCAQRLCAGTADGCK